MKQIIKEREVSLVIHPEVLLEKKACPFSAKSFRSCGKLTNEFIIINSGIFVPITLQQHIAVM